MKKFIKLAGFVVLTAVIVLSMAICNNEPIIQESGEIPYAGDTLAVSGQQIWTQNRYATKISQVYIPYQHDEPHNILALMYMLEDESGALLDYPAPGQVGSGRIINGVLDFDTSVQLSGLTEKKYLLKWKYAVPATEENEEQAIDGFRSFFSRYWANVNINNEEDNDEIKGNMVLLAAFTLIGDPVGMLDRQGMFGTQSTITCETILYLYVNQDCLITGDAHRNYIPGQYYFSTKGNLYLPLQQGWNLVSRKETYGTNFNGHSIISMEIKNPLQNPENYKWVMEPGFGL